MEENKTDSIKEKIANDQQKVNKEKEQSGKKFDNKKNVGTKTTKRSTGEVKKKKFFSIFSFNQILLILFIFSLICIGGFLFYNKEESFDSSISFIKNLFISKDDPITTDVNTAGEADELSIDSDKNPNTIMEENDFVDAVESPESSSDPSEVENYEDKSLTDDLVPQTGEQLTEQPNGSGSIYSGDLTESTSEVFVPQELTPEQRVLPLISKEKRELLKLIRKGSSLVSKLSMDNLKITNDIQKEDSLDEVDNLITVVLQKLKNLVKVRKIDKEDTYMEDEYKIEFIKQRLLTELVSCSSMVANGLYDEAIVDIQAMQNTLMKHFNVESESVEVLSNIMSRIKNKLKTLNENG